MPSDTPRTDAAWAECVRQGGIHEPFHGPLSDECQKLERELATAKQQIADLETLCDPAGIVRENALVSRNNIELLPKIIDLKRELAAETERAEEYRLKNQNIYGRLCKAEQSLHDAERQRDEMLVALNLGKRQAGESPVQTIMRLNAAERRAEENARENWKRGLQDAFDYLGGSTFGANQIDTVNACRALIRSLMNNEQWGPKAARSEEGKRG